MLKKIVPALFAAALVVLMLPCVVSAYGAAHVGYTHVGPSGVYHTGETAAHGPGGTYATGHTTAVGAGGGAYHSEYRAGATSGGVYGVHTTTGTTGGYLYAPSQSGAAYGRSTSYGYVR